MKKNVFFLCLLLAAFLVPVAVTASGNISVISSPAGAMIYIDGTLKGPTETVAVVFPDIPAGFAYRSPE